MPTFPFILLPDHVATVHCGKAFADAQALPLALQRRVLRLFGFKFISNLREKPEEPVALLVS